MIKLKTAHIEEVRGIRKLDIDFATGTFAISGPNGSGKSGVIDAIEFGLTGHIGRLTGRGTKGLSVAEHGPHVDKTKFPDAAFVELEVFLPSLKKSATITRKISDAKKPKILPDTPDVRAALEEIADHPEITLSRREILRFILVEPSTRSEEIQTILKLDQIGQMRSALNTAQNKLGSALKAAESKANSNRDTLLRHLQTASLQASEILAAVNARREVLGLPKIESLTPDTTLDAGLAGADKQGDFNKQSALRDLKAVSDAIGAIRTSGQESTNDILRGLSQLEDDPSLFDALHRRSLIEKGLDLVDGPDCPLCDRSWDDEKRLRDHLQAKLARSEEARKLHEGLLRAGADLAREVARLSAPLGQAVKIAGRQGNPEAERLLAIWVKDLEELKTQLTGLDGLISLRARLATGWPNMPEGFQTSLTGLTAQVNAAPDQTATIDAQTFLTTAQLRLHDYRAAMRAKKGSEISSEAAKAAYEAYCRAMEDELNALYDAVQEDFSAFYRTINGDDELKFTAKLTPTEGKLNLDVNFYERGLFPPGAYHSEGHQDGMGVCLYLALMKRLFGERFTIALLDDVVMSVDSGHRYQFCKLLKEYFPDTQFVITTHDRLWAEQMRSAGLVTSKTSLAFHSWTVDTGPLVESNVEIWDELAQALAKGKAEIAAAGLRHHLEYVSRHLADVLSARPAFRSDGNYELGELLPSVLARLKELYGKAAASAQSWDNSSAKEAVAARKATLSSSNAASSVEQWAVNKAVHYNEWANFGKTDFAPVVSAFRELLDCFRCDACQSWLYAAPPRGTPEALRCSCNAINMNLKLK